MGYLTRRACGTLGSLCVSPAVPGKGAERADPQGGPDPQRRSRKTRLTLAVCESGLIVLEKDKPPKAARPEVCLNNQPPQAQG